MLVINALLKIARNAYIKIIVLILFVLNAIIIFMLTLLGDVVKFILNIQLEDIALIPLTILMIMIIYIVLHMKDIQLLIIQNLLNVLIIAENAIII